MQLGDLRYEIRRFDEDYFDLEGVLDCEPFMESATAADASGCLNRPFRNTPCLLRMSIST